MKEIYWIHASIPGRLGIMARPRGGDWLETDVQHLHQAKVDILVSLLTHPEIYELELTEESICCQKQSIQFISCPIKDRDVPESVRTTRKLVEQLIAYLSEDKNIVIHCRMGIGRSSLIAASILATYGIPVEEGFSLIEQYRGLPVPDTQAQRDWVTSFAVLK